MFNNFTFCGRGLLGSLQFKPYYRDIKCDELEIPFQSKTDIVKEFIQNFNKPSKLKKYILMDSWYTSNSLIDEALSENYHLIGGVRSNRNFHPDGNKIKIYEFANNLDPNTLDSVTVRGKEYKVYRYQGKVAQIDNKVLLISFEARKNGFEKSVYILSTDTALDNKTTIDYYLVRWNIETSYHNFKENVGLDQYRIIGLISIERYFLVCFLAYTFLEVFRVSNRRLSLKTNHWRNNYSS
ncbi:transposase [Clostridium sp. Cult2]|uniref:transposase n=1 Tax=Clostridium sp. Cult2 TaxID=2079003 RepID=UPI001F007966|nr:transposase [Clostridium sp. Cult2]